MVTGQDGYRLLKAVTDRRAPGWLREIPAVDVLRRVWIQQYTIGAEDDKRRHVEDFGAVEGSRQLLQRLEEQARSGYDTPR